MCRIRAGFLYALDQDYVLFWVANFLKLGGTERDTKDRARDTLVHTRGTY